MNMNLKGILPSLGAEPGQVVSNPYARAFAPQPTIKEAEGEDHEVSMANNSIDTIIKMANELKAKMGENEKEIPAWIQDHIAKAENLISQASSNYHEYGTNESVNEGIWPKSKLSDRFEFELDAELKKNFKGRFYVVGHDLYHNNKKVLTIDGDKDSINAIVKKLKSTIKESINENARIVLVNPNTNKFVKTVMYSGPNNVVDKEVEKLNEKLPNSQKQKGFYWKVSSFESVNEVSYNIKADNPYQFINGAVAVLGAYVRDEKLESGVKTTLQRVVRDLEGLRKYFFSRKDESVNEAFNVNRDLPTWLFDDPVDFEGWYDDGMKLDKGKGKLAPFSSSDEKKLIQLVGIWQDAEGDYQFGRPGARSDSYRAQDAIKKLLFLKGKVVKTEGKSINEGKTYSNKFAAWFTGTVLNTVKHPTYGKHQLTSDQIEKSSGDYKNKLFKAIELAVKNGDITNDVIRKNESLRLTKLK